jgi:hypothetical protein
MIDTALAYVLRGWSIIPVTPTKKPLVPWKRYQERRPTVDEIHWWWDRPKPPGLAVVCGEVSGIVVFDVEAHALDKATYQTLSARSQSGGRHYYFKYNGTSTTPWTVEGTHCGDLKSDGGYVLAPPTIGTNGRYQWENDLGIEDPPTDPVFLGNGGGGHRAPPSIKNTGVGYASRSERLMAIARRVVNAGGGFEAVREACWADVAGSKLVEKRDPDKYLMRLTERAREYAARAMTVRATVVGGGRTTTDRGERILVKLKTDDGRIVNEGVTQIDGERWRAFQRVPLTYGSRVTVELMQQEWEGRQIVKVRRWL